MKTKLSKINFKNWMAACVMVSILGIFPLLAANVLSGLITDYEICTPPDKSQFTRISLVLWLLLVTMIALIGSAFYKIPTTEE